MRARWGLAGDLLFCRVPMPGHHFAPRGINKALSRPSDVKVYGGGYVNGFRVAEVKVKGGHGVACEVTGYREDRSLTLLLTLC